MSHPNGAGFRFPDLTQLASKAASVLRDGDLNRRPKRCRSMICAPDMRPIITLHVGGLEVLFAVLPKAYLREPECKY